MRHTIKRKGLNKTRKRQKQFLYNPDDPKKSFDVYIDKNPKDTIPIRYKAKKYPHKRIWQVGMIMKVRLEVLKNKKPKEYKLANRYFKFLSNRTDLADDDRYKSIFII